MEDHANIHVVLEKSSLLYPPGVLELSRVWCDHQWRGSKVLGRDFLADLTDASSLSKILLMYRTRYMFFLTYDSFANKYECFDQIIIWWNKNTDRWHCLHSWRGSQTRLNSWTQLRLVAVSCPLETIRSTHEDVTGGTRFESSWSDCIISRTLCIAHQTEVPSHGIARYSRGMYGFTPWH